jgi:endo-alpha-1,4-polygalactosaminidase (GH114 family)
VSEDLTSNQERRGSNIWRPKPGITWQWQLTDVPVDTSLQADVYDIDIFDNDREVVKRLHAHGCKVIGYTSIGSLENWRPDAGRFPAELIGKEYEGWPGERWLDIRHIDLLAPIMSARLDLCAEKGFDALEPDNIDIHKVDTGFAISYEDQLQYAKWLAEEAHARGLSIGLKNAPDQVMDLLPIFDFAIVEDCFFESWQASMLPFIEAGKAVLAAEYTDTGVDFKRVCQLAAEMKFSVILKNRSLDAWLANCADFS